MQHLTILEPLEPALYDDYYPSYPEVDSTAFKASDRLGRRLEAKLGREGCNVMHSNHPVIFDYLCEQAGITPEYFRVDPPEPEADHLFWTVTAVSF